MSQMNIDSCLICYASVAYIMLADLPQVIFLYDLSQFSCSVWDCWTVAWRWFKVGVNSILNVWSEFVTPQKNVLSTQPNLSAKKNWQVNKIRYQNLDQNKLYSLLSNAGACPLAAMKPRPLTGKLPSLNCLPLAAYLIRSPNCFVNDRNQVEKHS